MLSEYCDTFPISYVSVHFSRYRIVVHIQCEIPFLPNYLCYPGFHAPHLLATLYVCVCWSLNFSMMITIVLHRCRPTIECNIQDFVSIYLPLLFNQLWHIKCLWYFQKYNTDPCTFHSCFNVSLYVAREVLYFVLKESPRIFGVLPNCPDKFASF